MRVAIVGAGISGLTCARLLSGKADVVVFESDSSPGGLVRCRQMPQGLFHLCGGHVFNTKIEEVRDWFWRQFDQNADFVKARRNSAVYFDDGRLVGYPIEDHAYQLDENVFCAFLNDLDEMESRTRIEPRNFAEFLEGRFGRTLYELYFKPYNEKIWRCDLRDIPLSWLQGKLPMPTVAEMRMANVAKTEESKFVHSSFWYERTGGSQFLIDSLAVGVKVKCNFAITSIVIKQNGKVEVGNEDFDQLIFCGNVRDLPDMLNGVDIKDFGPGIKGLKSHGTTTAFCEVEGNPYSWIYQPSKSHLSHRIICTGNFSELNNAPGHMTATVEFTDYVSGDEIRRQLGRMPLNPRFIASHFTACSYPIQDAGTRNLIDQFKQFLSQFGIGLVGRFAEWEYFNMDAAMCSAMKYVELLPL